MGETIRYYRMQFLTSFKSNFQIPYCDDKDDIIVKKNLCVDIDKDKIIVEKEKTKSP